MAERAAKQLELNKSELPNSITEVIATLTRAGFDAYIVGGGVRDTLLGLRPKDFDAVTDAKPHEIKDVFGKRCRIIGRRFQLAHVYSGRELIEVATFRGPPINDSNTNQDGMILRDNVWGDIKQDFARRDFSINALYYQPLKGVVHDFCGALEDIDNKIIRLLGNAPTRIEEDPVRLLRALRFKAKLGFEFDSELAAQFHDGNWSLLEQISPHRLYDETQKMFTGGYLVPLLPLLFKSGAIDNLIIYPPSEPSALVKQVAINTDKRIGAGKSINPAFFYAALLWENYLHQLEKAKKRNMPFADAQMHAAGKVIDRQRIKTAIPKFAEQFIRDIWILQPKLAAPRSKQIVQLSEHPRFRAGFDFLLLREQCGDAEHPLSESTNDMGEWWQTYQTLTEQQQDQAIDDFDENIRRGAYKQGQRGRGRNRQKPQNSTDNAKLSQLDDDYQDKSLNNAKTARVNDASNVPSRRRRASQHTSANDKGYSPQQVKQDNNELAQLQQLSLASRNDGSNQQQYTSKPAPLFVIEHGNVVPPLQKQLAASDKSLPKATQKAPIQKVLEQETVGEKLPADNQSQSQEKSANKANDLSNRAHEPKASVDTHASSNNARSSAYAERNVAQSPALVSMNNEPIPHKRRRRQPTEAENTVTKNTETKNTGTVAKANGAKKVVSIDSNSNEKAADKYAKKSPKPADNSTDNAIAKAPKPVKAKRDANSQSANNQSANNQSVNNQSVNNQSANGHIDANKAVNSNMNANKGPVPSKRRRRQPSTDDI